MALVACHEVGMSSCENSLHFLSFLRGSRTSNMILGIGYIVLGVL